MQEGVETFFEGGGRFYVTAPHVLQRLYVTRKNIFLGLPNNYQYSLLNHPTSLINILKELSNIYAALNTLLPIAVFRFSKL